MTTSQGFTWIAELAEQLTWYGQHLMQPRLTGLTDAEYFWEPVPGCWNVRPRGGGPGARRRPAGRRAEIALLRDLCRARPSQPVGDLTTATLVP